MDLVGGSEDGTRYDGVIANPYYWQADYGRVGARFKLIPDARLLDQVVTRKATEFDRHHFEIYEIEERREEWDHIYVRARYLGRGDAVPLNGPA
jgi:hypothetical protein